MILAKARRPRELSQQQIDRLLRGAEAEFKASFMELITHISGQISTAEVVALLQRGELGQAIISTEKLALGLSGTWAELFQAGGKLSSQFIQDSAAVTVRFDLVNSRAVSAIKQAQLRLIRSITEEQRLVIRDILTRGVTAGINPREVAREIRGSIGLTRYQQGVVQSYRELLERGSAQALTRELRDARFDGTVRRALREGRPLPRAEIDRMVDRYRERWVNYRAETIARTEGLRAASEGVQEGFIQAVEEGTLAPDDIKRTWLTRHDGRAREWHLDMHRQERGLEEPFVSGLGNLLMEPRDESAPAEETIECRCRVTYRMR